MDLYAQKCWNSTSQFSVHERGNPSNCLGVVYAPRGRYWMTVMSAAHPSAERGRMVDVARVTSIDAGIAALADTMAEAA